MVAVHTQRRLSAEESLPITDPRRHLHSRGGGAEAVEHQIRLHLPPRLEHTALLVETIQPLPQDDLDTSVSQPPLAVGRTGLRKLWDEPALGIHESYIHRREVVSYFRSKLRTHRPATQNQNGTGLAELGGLLLPEGGTARQGVHLGGCGNTAGVLASRGDHSVIALQRPLLPLGGVVGDLPFAQTSSLAAVHCTVTLGGGRDEARVEVGAKETPQHTRCVLCVRFHVHAHHLLHFPVQPPRCRRPRKPIPPYDNNLYRELSPREHIPQGPQKKQPTANNETDNAEEEFGGGTQSVYNPLLHPPRQSVNKPQRDAEHLPLPQEHCPLLFGSRHNVFPISQWSQ
eukprot:Hpha_TRINITY_DN12822_c0_g1::TRINITY_DN12822_c0_g1_i1::g.24291::m.24291